MKRTAIAFALLAVSAPTHPAEGISMWGCSPVGERQKILYLADRGTRSYIKFSGQRISAKLAATEAEQRWTFGANAIVLTQDGFADYVERGSVKARFKCAELNR